MVFPIKWHLALLKYHMVHQDIYPSNLINYCGLKLKYVKHNAYVATWIIKKSIAEIILFWKQSEEPVVSRKRRALESDDCNCERVRSKFYQMYNADGPNLEKLHFLKARPCAHNLSLISHTRFSLLNIHVLSISLLFS